MTSHRQPLRSYSDGTAAARAINVRLAALGVRARVELRAITGTAGPGRMEIVPVDDEGAGAPGLAIPLDGDRSPGWVDRAVERILERRAIADATPVDADAATEPAIFSWCDPA